MCMMRGSNSKMYIRYYPILVLIQIFECVIDAFIFSETVRSLCVLNSLSQF